MRTVFLIGAACALFLCSGCHDAVESKAVANATADSLWDVEAKREWAARLRSEGLDDQALVAYAELLRDGEGLSKNAIIGASVVVAEIHMKKGRFEQALASLYRASQLGPESELKRRIDGWKINCLERLGKTAAADRLLDKASAPDAANNLNDASSGVVVARVGQEEILLAELEGLIAQQPAEIRTKIAGKAEKLSLLKNLVAQRVLERKARKLGLDKDSKVQWAISLATRDVLVRKMVVDEVRDKIQVSAEDAKLYYEAHKQRFREPLRLELAHLIVENLEREKEVRELLATKSWAELCAGYSQDLATSKQSGRIAGEIIEGQDHEAFADLAGLFRVVGETKAGAVTAQSLSTSKGRHLLKILKRSGGRQIPFEEVQDHASRMLRAEREQTAIAEMMKKALEDSDVQIIEGALDS